MVTLLASIAGFVSSILPEIVRLIKDKNDKRHELDIMDRQIAISKLQMSQQLQEIDARQDELQYRTLYETYSTGVSWVDALNGTVRPVMAYSFFVLYTYLKYWQIKCVTPTFMAQYLEVVWNPDDQAIFAGIISFYFGQRTFTKLWKKY